MNQINHGICYDDIANMTYESGYVGYFDFADIFTKLKDDGNIQETGDNIFNITQRGRAIAENLEHLIPTASKLKGTAVAARYYDLKKSGAVHSCTLEEESDGYRFECVIKDTKENIEILNISMFVKDKATAEKISGTFKENPNSVYRGIYAMLTGNADFLF